jgi:hypothetical protein
MTVLRTLLAPAAWLCVGFVVEVAFAGLLLGSALAWIVGSYVVAVGLTFALHPVTRGPVTLALAFTVCAALTAQGIYFAANGDLSLARRLGVAFALSLPLVFLVVRRPSCDERDDWFRAHAKRVVPVALAVAVPALVASVLGARSADPAPYERAVAVLGHNPFRALGDRLSATMTALTDGVKNAAEDGGFDSLLLAVVPEVVEARSEPELRRREFARTAESQERLTRFLSPWSNVERPILDEVRGSCGRFIQNDPERASECADELLRTRAATIRARRDDYRTLGLVSAVPWAIAGLFLWRGRRDRAGVHALPAV